MRSRSTALVGVLLCLLAFAGPAYAQEQTGSIQGVVKDASGSVLPGVTVEARNGQGSATTAVTNAQGVYRFPALAPGPTRSPRVSRASPLRRYPMRSSCSARC